MLNYNIRISAVKDGNHEYNFNIDSKFFESFNNSEVTNSQIKATVILHKDGNRFKLTLNFDGEIYNLMCDLFDSEMTISINNSISVLLSVRLFILPAKAVAHAAVPHAFVSPAPRSHTFTLILF